MKDLRSKWDKFTLLHNSNILTECTYTQNSMFKRWTCTSQTFKSIFDGSIMLIVSFLTKISIWNGYIYIIYQYERSERQPFDDWSSFNFSDLLTGNTYVLTKKSCKHHIFLNMFHKVVQHIILDSQMENYGQFYTSIEV